MTIKGIRAFLVITGAIIALTALSANNLLSRQVAREQLKGVSMDMRMGLSVPEGFERATFGHG